MSRRTSRLIFLSFPRAPPAATALPPQSGSHTRRHDLELSDRRRARPPPLAHAPAPLSTSVVIDRRAEAVRPSAGAGREIAPAPLHDLYPQLPPETDTARNIPSFPFGLFLSIGPPEPGSMVGSFSMLQAPDHPLGVGGGVAEALPAKTASAITAATASSAEMRLIGPVLLRLRRW